MEKFNLMNDAMFKALFRSVEARGMVSCFLSSITGIDRKILLNAKYIGGEIPKNKLYEKGKTSDCLVLIDDYNRIIVEMNQSIYDFTFNRNSSYAFSNIIELTRPNRNLNSKVILINIDDKNMFPTDKPIISFQIKDEEGNIETNCYHSIHLILENMVNCKYNIDKEVQKFSKLLKLTTLKDIKNEFKGDDNYMSAYRKIEDLTYDPEFAGQYDIEEARNQELYLVRQDGISHGLKQGIEQGLEQGIQEGSLNARQNGAKAMLKDKMDIHLISKYTNLSISDIEKLKLEM